MALPAIEVHDLTKLYELGEVRQLAGGWMRRVFGIGGKPPPMLKALDSVSLTVEPGEAIGIIGSNGAGKSTLLKLLTRVTAPSSGHGIVRGRVGTILEVGTGFHPELTGRENIYLSGAILGLRWHEVRSRIDSIVEFAGVGEFVDVPVKRYSSGMYVRLAFSVAAHLDPDILVVDEVLAVGDIGFQKRCLQRMEREIQQQGRTLLFVSHNLHAIRNLCRRSILLEKGRLIADGMTSQVIQEYLGRQTTRLDLRESSLSNRKNRTGGRTRFMSLAITDERGEEKWCFRVGETIYIRFRYEVFESVDSVGLLISFASPSDGTVISTIKETLDSEPPAIGDGGERCVELDTARLRPGSIAMTVCLGNDDLSVFEDIVDSNVKLPFLEIEADEQDAHRRSGFFDLDYRLEAS